jgi:streptogramin lyase
MSRKTLGLLMALSLLVPRSFAAVGCGDLNGDGKVNVADATTSLRIAVGSVTATDTQKQLGDLNKDGKINVLDATLTLRSVVGLLKIDGLCQLQQSGPYVSTVVGDPNAMANGPASQARFQLPSSVSVDSKGNLIVGDLNNHAIRQITPDGAVSTIAGNGVSGFKDGPISQALLGDVWFVEVGPDDAIYFADSSNLRVRRIDPARTTVATIAGNPALDDQGFPKGEHKDGPGDQARFYFPVGLAVDASNNVYVADADDYTIRKISLTGTDPNAASSYTVTTGAGNQQYGYSDGDALSASFRVPAYLTLAKNGDLYISDWGNEMIRILTPDGQVTTFAGNPMTQGGEPIPGFEDGPEDTAQFGSPRGLAFGGDTLYVADSDFLSSDETTDTYVGSRIRALAPNGDVSTLAGSDQIGFEDGKGAAATFRLPYDVAALPDGTVYAADFYNHAIRKIDSAGNVTTIAGEPPYGYKDGPGPQARLSSPEFIATDGKGTLYIADYGNNRIRKLTKDGTVSTLIGQDGAGDLVDGPLKAAKTSGPSSIAVASDGSIYFTDRENHVIRKIDAAQTTVTTFAGTGQEGFKDGAATEAQFDRPRYIQFGPDGNLYVSDTYNHRIRKITPDGQVSTVAGGGTTDGYVDGKAADARFSYPQGLAIAPDGTIYVADIGNQRVRTIDPQGNVTTLAGNPPLDDNQLPLEGYQDGPGDQAQFANPGALLLQADGSLLLSDRDNNRIRKIMPDGTTSTVAGIFDSGFWDGPLDIARFDGPFGMAFDTDGTIFIAEENNDRIRRLKLQ